MSHGGGNLVKLFLRTETSFTKNVASAPSSVKIQNLNPIWAKMLRDEKCIPLQRECKNPGVARFQWPWLPGVFVGWQFLSQNVKICHFLYHKKTTDLSQKS